MTAPSRGLYEILITEALEEQLLLLGGSLEAIRGRLRAPEAPDRIALHMARVIERAIAAIDEGERAAIGIDLARRLIDMIRTLPSASDLAAELPVELGEVLHSVVGHLPDGRPESIAEPLIPLLDTTLLTNAPGEPRVGHQVLTEIYSADRIDVVMAFIRRSGIAPLMPTLRAHCAAGRGLRVMTTTYTGSTEARALDELQEGGADIRVSYDTTARVFMRRHGYYTDNLDFPRPTSVLRISRIRPRLVGSSGMFAFRVPAIRMSSTK